jgi:outer membrane protein OmpA-like peptidoglycan-associated protein
LNVHFKTGSAELTPESEASWNEALTALKEHSDWKIRVERFTDNQGSKEAT